MILTRCRHLNKTASTISWSNPLTTMVIQQNNRAVGVLCHYDSPQFEIALFLKWHVDCYFLSLGTPLLVFVCCNHSCYEMEEWSKEKISISTKFQSNTIKCFRQCHLLYTRPQSRCLNTSLPWLLVYQVCSHLSAKYKDRKRQSL